MELHYPILLSFLSFISAHIWEFKLYLAIELNEDGGWYNIKKYCATATYLKSLDVL